MKRQIRHKGQLVDAVTKEATVMIRGTLVELRCRCGRPGCACADDPSRKHTKYYLSFSEAGKTRMVYIPKAQVGRIREAIDAWRRFKESGKQLSEANLQELLRRNTK